MSSVQANGITIEYEIRGEGQPVLLVMGLGGQLTDWPEQFVDAIVDRGFATIVFDSRDIGLSSETAWEPPSQAALVRAYLRRKPLKGVRYTIDDMAADAAGLLRALDIDSAHVVGISMGAMICQALTINHSASVKSLCSIMSNTGDRKNGLMKKSFMWKARKFLRPTREISVEEGVEMFRLISGSTFDAAEARRILTKGLERSHRPEGAARQTAAIAGSPDRTSGLRHVKVPTLVMHGLQDPLVLPTGAMATSRAVPGSRLLMFPDMGHDLPPTRTDEMVDAIVSNFARARAY